MAKELIFLTGASGFIGARTLQTALKAGYRVRASVRQEAQVEQLKKLFSEYAAQLEVVVIPDLLDTEATSKALKDVQYVLHIASPMPKGGDLQKDYLEPAIQGTEVVLNAAASPAGANIKRVVIMSSILSQAPVGWVYSMLTEAKEGINRSIDVDLTKIPTEGSAVEGLKYSASKILAHRATLDWADARKASPPFPIVTLHPNFVIGHDLWQPATGGTPGGVNAMFMNCLVAAEKPYFPSSVVDVGDVAQVAVRALTAPTNPGGEVTEVIVAGKATTWQEIERIVKEKFPGFPLGLKGSFPELPAPIDTTRAERDFGAKWREVEDIVVDVLTQYK